MQYLNQIDNLSEIRKSRIIMKTNKSQYSDLSIRSSSLPNITSLTSNENSAEMNQNALNFSPFISSQNDVQKQVYFSDEKYPEGETNQKIMFI